VIHCYFDFAARGMSKIRLAASICPVARAI
jgi:hypothetical protein